MGSGWSLEYFSESKSLNGIRFNCIQIICWWHSLLRPLSSLSSSLLSSDVRVLNFNKSHSITIELNEYECETSTLFIVGMICCPKWYITHWYCCLGMRFLNNQIQSVFFFGSRINCFCRSRQMCQTLIRCLIVCFLFIYSNWIGNKSNSSKFNDACPRSTCKYATKYSSSTNKNSGNCFATCGI